MRLANLPQYGHLSRPKPREYRDRRPTAQRCPECRKGRVVHLCEDPGEVRYVCSRRCGWDA